MNNKLMTMLVICLLGGLAGYANTGSNGSNGSKEKNQDPDMNGIITFTETGKPLKDVNITAYSVSKKEKVAVSDVNGNFSLIDLKPGVYKFVFQKDGFQKVVREKIVLKTNEDYQLNIQMTEDETIFDLMPSPLRFTGVR
jgi:Carboxypeptidase regulatory-like domain